MYAAPGALRVLRAGARGRITVAGRGWAYARLGDDHVLLGGVEVPFGPLSLALAPAADLDLRPGAEVAAQGRTLTVGGVPVGLERMRTRGRAAAPGAPVIVECGLVAAVASLLPPLPASLSTGVRALEAGKVDEAVAALAGRGAGLTPDGDDILAGYAAWRHAAGEPVRLARLATARASPIGLSYLRCAEVGEVPPAAAALLAALRAGQRTAPATVPRLLAWGSSSGAALAYGLLAGARGARPPRTASTAMVRRPG